MATEVKQLGVERTGFRDWRSAPQPGIRPESTPSSSKIRMPTTTKRVLLVDDDEAILETTRFALQQHGYEVLLARDGTEALMRVERDAPDLVILDVVMPRRSGFAVLARLRRLNHRCPRIVMVSGDGDCRHQQAAHNSGADAFLQKPYELSHLLAEVQTLLE